MSAIHDAVEEGNLEKVERILSHDPAQAQAILEGFHDQPLHSVARRDHPAIVRALLSAGADVEARGDYGPPLHYAAQYGSIGSTRVLLEHGADINARDLIGFTPLVCALRGRNDTCPEVVRLLVEAGAQVDLSALVMMGDEEPLRARLLSDPDAIKSAVLPDDLIYDAVVFIGCKLSSEGGMKPRNDAAIVERYRGLVVALLKAGADINAVGVANEPALFEAARFASPATVRLLLDNGADVNLRVGNHGESRSVWGATRHKLIRALLLDRGFVPDAD